MNGSVLCTTWIVETCCCVFTVTSTASSTLHARSDVNDLVDELVAFVRTWYRGHQAVASTFATARFHAAVVETTKSVEIPLVFSSFFMFSVLLMVPSHVLQ